VYQTHQCVVALAHGELAKALAQYSGTISASEVLPLSDRCKEFAAVKTLTGEPRTHRHRQELR
jgi:hypothetical protein